MIELRSCDVPRAQRFDWWRELTARDLVPTWIVSDQVADFRASAKGLDLALVRISALEFPALRSVRTPRLIRRSDPELWELALVTSGSLAVEQARNSTLLRGGDFVLYDTSRPFDSIATKGPARVVILHLPRRAVPVPERTLRPLVARWMPSHGGPAALLSQYLRGLVEQSATLPKPKVARLGSAAIEIAAAYLESVGNAGNPLLSQARQVVLVREIKAFIARNLGQAQLSPSAIAAAHHISVGHLHRLFRHGDRTVGAFIREERLERCRADLANPRLVGRSVGEVGARWGFPDATVFSRTFKRAYGLPPGEYRNRHSRRPGS
jgi:AraC-like DNA-binding protein